MTHLEEARAWETFEREFTATHDPRLALRATLVDFEARVIPPEHLRVATETHQRILVQKYRSLIERVCGEAGAQLEGVCSFGRASAPEVIARHVLICVFSDAGFSARKISDGLGMSNSSVANCKTLRKSRPQLEKMVAKFAIRPRRQLQKDDQ